MPQLQPSWQLSAQTAAVLIVVAVCCALLRRRWAARVSAFSRDFAVVTALLGLWQWVGRYVHTRVAGAMERAESVYQVQRVLHLPDEVRLQQLILSHPWLVRAANTYYGYAHLNGMAIFLVWIWWRHRPQYARARTVIVLSTLACLLVQIVPVAPPRLLPGHGFVDTALDYGQSVYGEFGSGMANQLSAMPSVHVGWAVIVAVFVWRSAGRGWRWVGVTHAALTVWVVVVTANHWWLDGFVAAGFVAASIPVGARLDRWFARLPWPGRRAGASDGHGASESGVLDALPVARSAPDPTGGPDAVGSAPGAPAEPGAADVR